MTPVPPLKSNTFVVQILLEINCHFFLLSYSDMALTFADYKAAGCGPDPEIHGEGNAGTSILQERGQ